MTRPAPPVGRFALPLPESYRTVRDGAVELVTVWTGAAWRSA
jgi:hypothetical protein